MQTSNSTPMGIGPMFFFSLAFALIFSSFDGYAQSREVVPQLEEPATAIMIDPLYIGTNISTQLHMTPRIFYDARILKPGDFDFDLAIGTYGTDFDKLNEGVYLQEDTAVGVAADLGYRFGLFERLGPLNIPSEIYTQLPLLFGSHDLSVESVPPLSPQGMVIPYDEIDEGFALGKWVWGLRFGLLPETSWSPRTVLAGSVGFPIDDSLVSDSTDFDLRLTFDKHFTQYLIATLYGGFLFPGDGKELLTRAGAEEEGTVPYMGLLFQTDVSKLAGKQDPGKVWLHFGGTWRDALYDFGHPGPDYGEEEVQATVGLTFDLGWWGCCVGRPQGMVGMNYTVAGGPEEGEMELVTRFRFPYWTGKHWPCNQ